MPDICRFALFVALVLVAGGARAQEAARPVPKDSERIAIPGCARGRAFTVGEAPEHEPVRGDIAPGRRFRLAGPKKVLEAIRLRQARMIEITGLVRKRQLSDPGGVTIAGGRIRIGGAMPRAPLYGDSARDPMYNQVVIDVESWRPLERECPER